jgi:hypothetical protein
LGSRTRGKGGALESRGLVARHRNPTLGAPSRSRHSAGGRMAAKGANAKTTPNVNAFTYAARLPDHNSGVPAK